MSKQHRAHEAPEMPAASAPPVRRLRRRLEPLALSLMALGALMMFQPFTITLYSYSFLVILIGTLMFIVVSHFPE